MNSNIIIGTFLLIIAAVCIVLAFIIALKQYILVNVKAKAVTPLPDDLLRLFLQLLDDILKAPPALSFLAAGLLIGAAGIWVLVVKPM